MTVKRLIEILKDAPQDMPVYVSVNNEGFFAFAEACECETGVVEFGPPMEAIIFKEGAELPTTTAQEIGEAFCILSHGFTEENENGEVPPHVHN